MVKKLLSLICVIVGLQSLVWGQGDLKGVVKDASGQPVPFATVAVLKDNVLVTGATTDFDGKYFIKGVQTGRYTIRFSSVGYATINNTGVLVETDKITFLDATMVSATKELNTVEVVYKDPLIKKDDVTQVSSMDRKQIMKIPTANIYSVATTFPGVFSRDGEIGSVRGARSGVTVFIDGVKIRGTSLPGLPRNAVEGAQLILGGVPAKYGDATGGIFEITTRNISNKYFGGVEARTSKFLDNYEHYYFNGQIGGPMIKGRESGRPIAGFLATVEGGYDGDPSPVRGGSWKVRNDVMDRLINEPLRLAPAGQSGTRLNSEFLRASDFERINTRQNVAAKYLNVQGKLDFNFAKNTFLAFGGFVNLRSSMGGRDGTTYNNTLFNWENNPLSEEVIWNAWGRITQNFGGADTGRVKRAIKNARISLQVDYLKGFSKTEDALHGNNFFNYGYVGKFTTYRAPTYAYGYDPKLDMSGWLFTGNRDTLVTFTPSDLNPMSSTITSQYYTFYNTTAGNYDNFANLQNRGAIINGQQPPSIYGLWNNIGTRYNGYAVTNNSQFRAVFSGSIVIKDHDLQFGFEFEQRTDRAYSISPVALWTLARQYTNFHLGTVDTSQPTAVYQNGIYQDTINYPALYVADPNRPGFGLGQTFFDWNLRQKLGYAANSLNYIDVDDLDPSVLNLSMFSTDELLNGGNNLVSYYGYDAYGNISDGGSFEDFFLEEDQYGNKTRPIAPFQPIYMAGYIMDKFSFKDIIFNVGVRVDYYDANQSMLKDRYSLYQTQTVGDIQGGTLPILANNVQDDWVVYVNDKTNPTSIVGYRDGDTWYNATGQVINDPAALRTASGRVQPLLVDPTSDVEDNPNSGLFNAFTDYKPQVNVLPRIAFSFPVSDNTQFVAYYDVLTQRPSNAVRMNPMDYFFWDNSSYNSAGVFFNNPGLRPERTTDFSLGFRQGISESSAIKINAFYREMRDYVALVKVNEAYPRSYGSWQNIDFGTVKGLSLEYILTKMNFYLSASYTLQFADNTGSSNTSALNLVNSGQPNLRVTIPTDYDRRHLFTAFFSFDFGDPKDANSKYIGPSSKKSGVLQAIFQNLGFSTTLRGGSGVPYSRQSNFIPTQLGGGQASLLGSINGARLPWEFNVDLQVYKNINFRIGKKDTEGKKEVKKASLQIYLQVQNLFDIANTISVYAATSSATDDGYLTAPQYQPFIESQVDPQSFRDLYSLKVNDPRNFSLPRRVRLGAIFSF